MLKVWGRRSSQNVQKVLWLAGELGLEHEHVPAGGPYGRLSEPGFAALNPNRLVPVIEDGGLAVWESHAVLRYLAAAYGGEAFWPASPAERSWIDRWMDWTLTTWQPAFLTGVFWGGYRTPEADQDREAVAESVRLSGRLLGLIEAALGDGPYLLGPRLSLADIALGSALYRWFELDIERPFLPRVEAWYARLQERPAFREHVMVPFDELKGRLSF